MDLGDDLEYNYAHKRFYPSLFLIYNTHSDATYKLSFSRRINRPSHHEVNPIPDLKEINNSWIDQGNPFLNPEDIFNSELTYSFKTRIGYIKSSIFINKVSNLIDKDMVSYSNPQGNKTYIKFTSKNIAESLGKGFDVYFSTSPTTNWDIIFNGIYWHNEFTSVQKNSENIESGFNGKLNSILRLNNNQEIGVYSHFSSTTKINKGKIKPIVRVDLNYKKIINDNLVFKIKIKDLFNTNTYNVETKNYLSINGDLENDLLQEMNYTGRSDQRTITLNLEYKFGAFQKKKYRRDNSLYEENNDERVKF
jgi:outer membrane receptor for ferrienterochelin and colicin